MGPEWQHGRTRDGGHRNADAGQGQGSLPAQQVWRSRPVGAFFLELVTACGLQHRVFLSGAGLTCPDGDEGGRGRTEASPALLTYLEPQ